VDGPENQDTDFTWAEFLRRNNDELVAGWGNLVNRSVSMAAKNLGRIPEPGQLTEIDTTVLARSKAAFAEVGELLGRSRFKAAITEAMRVVADANKYLSDTAPWKLKETDPARMGTVLHTALQVVDDCKSLLTPFLPGSAQKVYELLGGTGVWSGMPELRQVDQEGGPSYGVLTGDYRTQARWESVPLPAGRQLEPPTPIFTKLDPSIVDDEVARLGEPE
jgi:methionyl-tRNA synthetase